MPEATKEEIEMNKFTNLGIVKNKKIKTITEVKKTIEKLSSSS